MALNWLLRYEPVVAYLDEIAAGLVLDVGAGWHGLAWYRTGVTVQTDLNFNAEDRPAADHRGDPTLVCASVESLPFANCAFDAVVSLDLFEHVPTSIRSAAVHELCRVARESVVVGFPVAQAEVADLSLALALRLSKRDLPLWLKEHNSQEAYPSEKMLQESLPSGWTISQVLPSGNVVLHTAVLYAEFYPRLRRLTERLEQRWYRHGVPGVMHGGRVYRKIFVIERSAW